MGALRYVGDSLRNLVANLGTARDKASHSHYGVPVLSDFEATNAYRGAWLPRKIVDIPAMDATRNWRNWQAEADDISAIEAEEGRLGVRVKVQEAMKKARLYGGAAIYIGTGDSDPSKELNPGRVGLQGIRHLNVMTRRVLQAGEVDRDPESPQYGRPAYYTLQAAGRPVQIHPSRLVVLTGAMHPDPETATGDEAGWGDSVLTAVMAAIKHADGTAANVASLVFEARVNVFKIPGLMQGLASGGEYERQLLDRLMLAATAKGINGDLILDSEEDFVQRGYNFAGLTDILNTALQIVSGAADIPVTRLLGQAPGGLNSSGESDLRNYYDRVKAMQELEVAPALHVLDECLIRSATGKREPDVYYDWRSLWQTTDKERADIGKTTADTIKVIDETKLLPDAVMAKVAVNMLTEAGVAPGLEAAMDEFVDPDDAPDDDERAALGARAESVADAEPRPLYVHRKVTNAAEIIAWAREQGFETTLAADDLHVTIAYSRAPVDWMKVGGSWSEREDGGITVRPGGARLIERFDGGAVVLLFNSSELAWRHESIKEAGASWDYPDYQPHITLTYAPGELDLSTVEPYRGAIQLGPEVFEPLDEGWKSKVTEE